MRLAGTWAMMAVVCVSDRASLTRRPEDDCQAQRPVLCCHIFLPCLRCFCLRRVLKSLRSSRAVVSSAAACRKRPIRGCQRLTVKASENAILHIDFYNKRMTNGELYLYSDNQSDTCIKRQFWSAFEMK